MRSLLALPLVLSSGCLFGEVSGISCALDDDCPSSYFCDIPRGECRAMGDVGPPVLQLQSIRDPAGEVVRTPFVPSGTTSRLVLMPDNTGGFPAEDVRLSFAELACVGLVIDRDSQRTIAPGAAGEIAVDVSPLTGCESLTIIDWFLSYSGRETRGTFDLNVKRPG